MVDLILDLGLRARKKLSVYDNIVFVIKTFVYHQPNVLVFRISST